MRRQPVQDRDRVIRCAIYTRKSTDEGLDAEFTSLDAQRESAESYIASQRHEGWVAVPTRYDDGGISGGTLERPALKRLLHDIEAGKIDCVICYKVDRLSRSLLDFSRLIEIFDRHQVTFISVTQAFNTTTSMGRLTLNVLLSFAQYEREIIGERIRDKIAAHKRKGMYTGGVPILGYDIDTKHHKLIVNPREAEIVRRIVQLFLEHESVSKVATLLNEQGIKRKTYVSKRGKQHRATEWTKATVRGLLTNHLYVGEVTHGDKVFPGEHQAILDRETWERIRAVFTTPPATRSAAHRQREPALLRGMIRCGQCGCMMVPTFTRRKSGKEYRYYVCMTAVRKTYADCPVRTVPAGQVEDAVRDYIHQFIATPEILAATYRHVTQQEQEVRERLQQEQERLTAQLTALRAREQVLFEQPTPEQMPTIQEVATEIAETSIALQQIMQEQRQWDANRLTEREVKSALAQLNEIWSELLPAEQTKIIQTLVEQVVIGEEGMQVSLRATGIHSLVSELLYHTATTSEEETHA